MKPMWKCQKVHFLEWPLESLPKIERITLRAPKNVLVNLCLTRSFESYYGFQLYQGLATLSDNKLLSFT